NQTRVPDELVICDDASTDESMEIARAFSRRAAFPVRLQRNSENLGSSKNFERAIQLCGGNVIALADQDDVWYSEKLERIESLFLSNSSAGLALSNANVIDENGSPLGYGLWDSIGFSAVRQKTVTKGSGAKVLLNR